MGESKPVKLVLSMVCSLLFLWGQVATVAAPSACALAPVRACCHAGVMPCCAAKPAPAPVSAVPLAGPTQPLSVLPVAAALLWVLPEARVHLTASAAASSSTMPGTPLRTRLCSFQI